MKVDIVMLTYGEPTENRFAEQYEYSRRILLKLTRKVAPIPKFAVPFLAVWRGYTRVNGWRKAGYTSPLEPITERQAEALRGELRVQAPEIDWRVHVAYEFRSPTQHEVLDRLRGEVERLILLPMYATTGDFTNGFSLADFDEYQRKNGDPHPKAQSICFRPFLDELCDILANYVRDECARLYLDEAEKKEAGLLLGCHGTVMKPPKGINNTGYGDTFAIYKRLERRLIDEFKTVRIGWLNHTLGGEWTSPNAEQSVQAMLEEGIERFIYYPFGFLADNAESQLEGRQVMADHGVENYIHLECVNTYPPFIAMLARLLKEQVIAGGVPQTK